MQGVDAATSGSGTTNNSSANRRTRELIIDVIAGLLLVIALLVVGWFDQRSAEVVSEPPAPIPHVPEPEPEPEPPPPPPDITPPQVELPPIDPTRRIAVHFSQDNRFGVTTLSGNPDDDQDDYKRLTYSNDGSTNNTRIWVDGNAPIVGSTAGRTVRSVSEAVPGRLTYEWEYQGIQLVRDIEFIAGDATRRMDTVQVDYRLKNVGAAPRDVGLRVMIDSLIGSNDGVPFIVPGTRGIVTSPQTYAGDTIPDFVRALERPDLVNPGVIVDLGLRAEAGERPDEVILTHWPGSDAGWNYSRTQAFGRDSAIGLYYSPRPLPPGQERQISFTYGLGSITSTRSKNPTLSLTAGGPFRAGGKFWIVALVNNPQDTQKVRLQLPDGFDLAKDHAPLKDVTADASYSQISWLVNISRSKIGPAEIEVVLEPDDIHEKYALSVQPRDARLMVVAKQHVARGKPFWVSALVQNARPEQTVELKLPEGLRIGSDDKLAKKLAQGNDSYSQVNWLVEAAAGLTGEVELQVRLKPEDVVERVDIEIQGSLID